MAKGRLAVLVAVGVWLSMPCAFASVAVQGGAIGGGNQLNSIACDMSANGNGAGSGCNALLSGPLAVIGWKVINANTNSRCAIYDATTMPSSKSTLAKDELSGPAQWDMEVHVWSSPMQFTKGVSVGCGLSGNGETVIVYY